MGLKRDRGVSRVAAFILAALLAVVAAPAWALTVVPPGNSNAEQPEIPFGSASRTKAGKTTYEAKYAKVYKLLATDAKLRRKIKQAAAQYGIDPLHIVGAIVGEHTYNVDAYDRLQTYYIKAVSYLNSRFRFAYDGESVADFLERPQFSECEKLSDSYEIWVCREVIWNTGFRGKLVDGRQYPNDRFSAVFFQPFYAGQTFGIGQLNPLTALQMGDFVHEVSGLPRLSMNDPQRVYATIMDPDLTLAYVAAALRKSIDAYRDIAGFDISQNPGITATLYNVGNPRERARALAHENSQLKQAGKPPRMPQENYYGWLVNEKLGELKTLF